MTKMAILLISLKQKTAICAQLKLMNTSSGQHESCAFATYEILSNKCWNHCQNWYRNSIIWYFEKKNTFVFIYFNAYHVVMSANRMYSMSCAHISPHYIISSWHVIPELLGMLNALFHMCFNDTYDKLSINQPIWQTGSYTITEMVDFLTLP